MNNTQAQGYLAIVRGRLLQAWGRIAGREAHVAAGRHLQLAGRMRVRLGQAQAASSRLPRLCEGRGSAV